MCDTWLKQEKIQLYQILYEVIDIKAALKETIVPLWANRPF